MVDKESEVIGWDEWFTATKDTESLKAWSAVKEAHVDAATRCKWATIIELNRLDTLEKTNAHTS